jgi:tRNA dimethylallyltransferase
MRISLVAVVGPTASGKTSLGIALAEALNGEIVSADSRQIYREMEIGTAKPTPAERARVPHHLLDVAAPDAPFTLAQYQEQATVAIADIHARGRLPILVGGTGLYLRAVLDGLAIPAVPPDPARRAVWEDLAAREGPEALHSCLAEHDPIAAAAIPATNVRRIIRALEVCEATGQPFSAQQVRHATPYALTMLGLNTDRARLYAWADARVDAMLAAGLVAEVAGLVARGYDWHLPAMSSLGYAQIGAYLRGAMTLPDAVQRLKWDTHGFIRKQLIWFRPDTRICWLDAAAPHLADQAIAHVNHAAGGTP